MERFLKAILENDVSLIKELLKLDSGLSASCFETDVFYETSIFHWLYVGDSALHLAAAGYRVEIVDILIAAGANPNFAGNHRGGTPLHYAADGYVNGPAWNPKLQVETINRLIDAGAEIDLQDKNGATPLHRAVRTRCAAAVTCLLGHGSDTTIRNKSGSTTFHLAVQNTGRGGSGSEEAVAGQRQIIIEFRRRGVSTGLRDGKGKTVLECARSRNVIELLIQDKDNSQL